MRAIFLDGQDARHVRKTDVRLVFEPVAQEIEILALRRRVVRILAEDAVPLVNDDDKRALCMTVNRLHHQPQIILTPIVQGIILLQEIPEQRLTKFLQQIIHILCFAQELLHIDAKHIGHSAIAREIRAHRNRESIEYLVRHGPVIVRADHIRRHCLAEPPRTAHTDIFPRFPIDLVELFDQC